MTVRTKFRSGAIFAALAVGTTIAGAPTALAGSSTAVHGTAATAAERGAAGTALSDGPVHAAGYESRSYIKSGGCEGWVYTKKSSGHWYARGYIRSSHSHCIMALQRRHGSGGYGYVSNEYRAVNETLHTGYHWDDKGYHARVCIQNYDHTDEQYRCGVGV